VSEKPKTAIERALRAEERFTVYETECNRLARISERYAMLGHESLASAFAALARQYMELAREASEEAQAALAEMITPVTPPA
jgi:hypothetical protein